LSIFQLTVEKGGRHGKDHTLHRSKVRVKFQNEDLDFLFQWLALGYGVYGGLSYGEAFAAAGQIEEWNISTWIGAFRSLGDRLHARAENHARNGRVRSAGETYLKAFAAYRASAEMTPPTDPSFRTVVSAFQADFRLAMTLLEIPAEPASIPYAGKSLPGYFLRGNTGTPRGRTLIGIGGGESYREDLYFFYGAAGLTRGYNLLLVDLPGQGTTPFDGLFFDVAFEKPIAAAVDYAFSRREVDPECLAIAGVSGGGYMVLRGAAYEKRIRAVVANTPIIDMGRVLDAEIPPSFLRAPKRLSRWLIRLFGAADAVGRAGLHKNVWQAGMTDPIAAMELGHRAVVDPARIECPILCLAGEGESAELRRQTRECYDRVRSDRKDMRIFTSAEGADSHDQVNNLPLWNQFLYDWLDGIFPK
jgi:pimeloyl-ACP methyl ester carboxylesterase